MVTSGKGPGNISFGIMWQYMSPYAHIKVPVPVFSYRVGIVLPVLLLGILPGIYALIKGDFEWIVFGFIFTVAAAGDIYMLWMIRNLRPGQRVKDHPEKLGCLVVPEQNA